MKMITKSLERKLLTMLEILANCKSISLKDFSEEMKVSTRSIRNYLKQLQDEIPSDIAVIDKNPNGDYELKLINQEKFRELLDLNRRQKQKFSQLNNPDERVDYLINRLVAIEDVITIDDLAEEMNVGRTTLVNDLKKVDKKLEEHGLLLKRKTNAGIKVEGDEINLRLIILENICKTYEDAKIMLDESSLIKKSDLEKLKIKLVENLKANMFSITEALLRNLIRYIAVMLIRLKHDKSIIAVQPQYQIILESEEYKRGKTLKNVIEAFLNIEISDFETIFIVMPLLGRNAPLYHEILRNIIINENITILRKQIFDRVFKFTGLKLEKDKQLIQGLEYHLYYALNRMVLNIKYKNPMLKEIKENYKLPYEIAKIAADVIEEKYKVHVDDDETGYLALHFGTYFEKADRIPRKIENACIVCGTGLGTAILLGIKLKKILGEKIVFNSYSDLDFNKEIADNYDIVFSLVDLELDTSVPIIRIKSIFDEDELKNDIERQLILIDENVAYSKNSDLEEKLDPRLVFHLDEATFMENLEHMLTSLVEENLVSETYKRSVLEREKKAATAFGGYIALPHAVDEDAKEVILSYGVLKKPIQVDGKEVGLIILMVIPSESKNNQDLIVKTYQDIIDLSRDKKKVQKLIKTRNYDEFIEILERR